MNNPFIRLLNGQGNWNTFSDNGNFPVITMSDGPHGLRKQNQQNYSDINNSSIATCFPTASASACSWNKSLLFLIGKSIGLEAKAAGVNLLLGPGMNIKRSPLCGRNFEYFSEDPLLTGFLAGEYVKGVQSTGTGACLKHFACNNQEKRRQTSNSIIDLRTLNEIYLSAFEYVIKESRPAAVMTSYNRVNGVYACHSPYLSGKLKEWGFDGLVVSDWGAAIDMPLCVKNGLHLAMPDSFGYMQRLLEKALTEGKLSEKNIQEAAEKILNTARQFPKQENFPEPDFTDQHNIAVSAAEECAVLLKNNGILPLKPGTVVEVAGVFCENQPFQGGGSSHVNTKHYPSSAEYLKQMGFSVIKSCKCRDKSVPVIFFCALDNFSEGEGFDRSNLSVPEKQIKEYKKLAAAGRKIILVTSGGSPMDLRFAETAAAILHMGLSGEGSSMACARLLAGKANPCGKLAETWPLPEHLIPGPENFGGNKDNIIYSEGTLYGYRHYESFNLPVQYEFGFGLSYTSFEYSDFKVEKKSNCYSALFTLTNTGKLPGAEICQLYVKTSESFMPLSRASISLAGFEKVYLEPQESRPVEISFSERAFSVFSTKLQQFVNVAGEYTVCICSSARAERKKCRVSVEGSSYKELFQPEDTRIPEEWFLQPHKKGSFTITDSLGDLSQRCLAIKLILGVFILAIRIMNFKKSSKDPAIKIAINAITENPVESLISTSGGMISEAFAKLLVKIANRAFF